LGPLQVASNGSPVPLGGAKQRAVLGLLVLNANEVVPLDRLIDELWGESPPESAANIVQGYISHLRKALEPGMPRGKHELLVSRPPGYTLRLATEQLDAERFDRLAGEGRRLLEEGDAEAASQRIREALALWRGPALADLAHEAFARADAERLEELRLAALEDRVDADLALGRHAGLVGELRELTVEHPLRERLRAQLMTALYRGGRQAEALEVFRDTRRALSEDLGIEPGPALRELEREILRHDPALGAPVPPLLRAPATTRGRRLALAGVLAVAVTGSAAAVVAMHGGSSARAAVVIYPHSVAVIDPVRNTLVDDVLVGAYPTAVAADDRFVYVANAGGATVSRIDAKTRKVVDTGALSRATDLVARDGHLWAADGGVPGHVAIPPGTVADLDLGSAAIRTIHVGPALDGPDEQTTLATDPRGFALWVGNADTETVREIDPSLDRIVRTVHGVRPGGLAPVVSNGGGNAVWASDPSRNLVVRIEGDAGRVVQRIRVSGGPTRLAADDQTVWVIAPRGRSVVRIDAATGDTVAKIALPITPRRILLEDGAIWITGYSWSNHVDRSRGGLVLRIDPRTNRIVARVSLGDLAADGIVLSRGLLWVAVPPSA
jgi:DNA-binding SARP family transcriptional activator